MVAAVLISVCRAKLYDYDLNIFHKVGNPNWDTSLGKSREKFMNEFYMMTSEKITLADGRKVTCQVPTMKPVKSDVLPLYFPEDIEPTENDEIEVVPYNLTATEAGRFLDHLTGTCAGFRTDVFLWEFCY